MKASIPAICLVVSLLAQPASAHAHLEKSIPSEGSVLASPPPILEMRFSEPARLTALSVQKNQEAKVPIKDLPSGTAPTAHLFLPVLDPGIYTVTWRVVSPDGHIMSGALHFTVAAKR